MRRLLALVSLALVGSSIAAPTAAEARETVTRTLARLATGTRYDAGTN